ncbi:MAG TPA: hypothetical protein VG897_18295 [Terriglobales bacterium]|nr:hypothetical protein [Terriglobales bacterium]
MIYYYFLTDEQIWLMTIYDKNEMADLSASEKKALREAVEMETKTRKARVRRERGK